MYKIIRDTREKDGQGWIFEESSSCGGMIVAKLDSGDYSLENMTNIISIERKGTITEFAQNLLEDRFERELERLDHIQHSFAILEFKYEDLISYPYSAPIPQSVKNKIKITGKLLNRKFCELNIKYNTKFIFAGKKGKECAESLFKRVYEKSIT